MNTEKPSFSQISDQFSKGSEATVLVSRSNGEITTGIYAGVESDTKGLYDVVVDGGDGVRSVSGDQLSDAHQALLAEHLAGEPLKSELGGVAVSLATTTLGSPTMAAPTLIDQIPDDILHPKKEEVVVEEALPSPQERMDILLRGLSPDDVSTLYRYSMYKTNKAEAQRRGDGLASQLAGQYMGQELRSMSAAAKIVADQYHVLSGQLS